MKPTLLAFATFFAAHGCGIDPIEKLDLQGTDSAVFVDTAEPASGPGESNDEPSGTDDDSSGAGGSDDDSSDASGDEPSGDEPSGDELPEDEDPGSDETGDEEDEGLSFRRVVLSTKRGSAWLTPIDVDSDGYDEYLLTSMTEGLGASIPPIGPGGAYVMSRSAASPAGAVGTWNLTEAFDYWDGIIWPNKSTVFDVNNDGIKDWVIGCGFLARPEGNLLWMAGEMIGDELRFGAPQYIDIPDSTRWYHEALPVDMDGDGDTDFVTTNHNKTVFAEGTSLVEWYENEGIAGEASFIHHEITDGGGALFTMFDVDEDGDQDIILPQFFEGESLVWLENNGVSTAWTRHVINDNTGRGFGVEMADMNGDGRLDLVYGNHNHQLSSVPAEQTMGIYWWEVPDAGSVRGLPDWDAGMNVVYEGFEVGSDDVAAEGAPGVVHTGDVNGDGRMDVSAAGDGDEGVYVFIQQPDGTFVENQIDSGLTMAGDHVMTDLDLDGDMDFIWAVFGPTGLVGPDSAVYAYLQD